MPGESTLGRKYAWFPSLPDFRDFRYAETIPIIKKPPRVAYLINAPVQDQGGLGSCVFNALTTAMENIEMSEHNQYPPTMYSRLFAYYNYRKSINAINEDTGADIRAAIKKVYDEGCCYASTWPYDEKKWNVAPPAKCFEEAKEHKIIKYYNLRTLDEKISCIASGYGFIFGFTVFSSFESDTVAKTGIVPMPQRNEDFLGGHAVYAVGYDLNKKMFKVQNSWSENWGQKGFFWMPFEYMTSQFLSMDFYTIRTITADD